MLHFLEYLKASIKYSPRERRNIGNYINTSILIPSINLVFPKNRCRKNYLGWGESIISNQVGFVSSQPPPPPKHHVNTDSI